MSALCAEEWHANDGEVDSGWCPGQPDLEEAESLVPESMRLIGSSDAGSGGSSSGAGLRVLGGLGPRVAGSVPTSIPTVLTKLQKWGDYESVGSQVLPTRFIPMKTPLSAEILDSWSLPSQPKHRLTVPEMVAQQAALGRKIGLLLDLSNHDCLYASDIPPGLAYTHVQLVAKELPPPEFVDAVVAVAKRFWAQHPDEYIAVHCAYGFNRTGFVVCCYLIECCGLSVEDALASFAESRPPGVKHEQFRNELHRRYGNAAFSAALYGVVGSPDDNSSFGYSPSCGSLDLRDLCGGAGGGAGSPVPGLTRGNTYDCLLAHQFAAAAAAAAAAGGGASGGVHGRGAGPVSSPAAAYRHSMDGHQTLTFTTVMYRRGSSGGASKLLVPPGAASAAAVLAATQLELEPYPQLNGRPVQGPGKVAAVPPPPGKSRSREGETQPAQAQGGQSCQQQQQQAPQQEGGGEGKVQPQQQKQQQQKQQEQQRGGSAGDSGDADGGQIDGGAALLGMGSGIPAEPSRPAAVEQSPSPSSSSSSATPGTAAATVTAISATSADGPHSACVSRRGSLACPDNESLGVNDRAILQTFRAQALAQLSAATIPEESGSARSTPARGCSSVSLADYDSTAGHSTPRPAPPGRFSHKSLDTIDWGAAAAAADEGAVAGPSAASGSAAPTLEALRLG